MDKQELMVAGYIFGSIKDAQTAREEEKKIRFIKSRLNESDPASVKIIYDKMLANRIFVTPVGLAFVQEVRTLLIGSGMFSEEDVEPIPLRVVFSEPDKPDPIIRRRVKPASVKTYFAEFTIARVIIAVLVIMVGAMFYITLKADNPNILNYETAIQNKYASWEQELKDREAVIRERERELNIE